MSAIGRKRSIAAKLNQWTESHLGTEKRTMCFRPFADAQQDFRPMFRSWWKAEQPL